MMEPQLSGHQAQPLWPKTGTAFRGQQLDTPAVLDYLRLQEANFVAFTCGTYQRLGASSAVQLMNEPVLMIISEKVLGRTSWSNRARHAQTCSWMRTSGFCFCPEMARFLPLPCNDGPWAGIAHGWMDPDEMEEDQEEMEEEEEEEDSEDEDEEEEEEEEAEEEDSEEDSL